MNETDMIGSLRRDMRGIAAKLEKRRVLYIIWLLAGITILSLGTTFLLLYINPEGLDLRYTVTVGALVPSVILYLILGRVYLDRGKAKLIKELCKSGGLSHRPDGCFSVGAAKKHIILPAHHKNKLDTGFTGAYNNVDFAMQEVFLTELRQDKKHKNRQKEYVRFWGLLLRIPMRGNIYGHTVVMPNLVRQVFFSKDFSGHEIIRTTDKKFDQSFDILTTDKVDAKVILNTSFKDQFLKTTKDLKAYWSEVSFLENEIFFAFQRFRPLVAMTPIWKPVTDKNLRHNIDELDSVLKLIYVLKANSQLNL